MSDAVLADALRTRGLRMTPQRQRVLDAVRSLGHATPEEISASLSDVDVDVATVYRAVQLLESLGLVAHTHLGHGAPSYRPADDEHIHVVCHDCGVVVDAPPGLAATLVRRLRQERGFAVDLAHFTVFGRCAVCTEGGGSVRAAGARHEHGAPAHAIADHATADHAGDDHAADDQAGDDHAGADHERAFREQTREQTGARGR